MPLRISSPKSFAQIRRSAEQAQHSMQVSLQRLSSGLRINQSADDAAGLAISERLSAQVRGALSSIQNMNLGTSLLQVAEGALNETQNALLRMRELSVFSATETLTELEREALNIEFKLLTAQIDLIAEQTQFNGIKLLSGTHRALELQVGYARDDLFRIELAKANATELGRQARYTTQRRGVFISDLQTGDININGVDIRGTVEADDILSYSFASGSAISKAKAINHSTQFTGVRAIVGHNVIRGFEPIRKISLDPQSFFKINGYAITSIDIEAKDASHVLVESINAGYDETGVVADVDADGHLVLTAEDGRNITVEYGDGSVRDAIRMIDYNGDPVNLINTIDPVQYNLDGDIEVVNFIGTGSYNGQYNIEGDVTIVNQTTLDTTGGFERPRDHVDFVLEIVNPGPIGVATYRFKEEALNDYTNDAIAEDYLFNAEGKVTSQNANISIQSASHYNEASDRTYTLTVQKSGIPDAVDPNDLPTFTYVVTNQDEASDVSSHPIAITADQGNPITLEHNVVIDFPVGNRKATDPNGGGNPTLFLNEDIDPIPSSPSSSYNDNPRFKSWTGDRLTDFTFEVVRAGHLAGSNAIAGSNTPAAQVKVSAWVPSLAQTFTDTFTLDPTVNNWDSISFRNLNIEFFGRKGATTTAQNLSGSYQGDFKANDSVYVGTETRIYEITMQEGGLITNNSALKANVRVLDSSNNELSSHDIEVESGSEIKLGEGNDFEGVLVDFTQSASRVGNVIQGVGAPNLVHRLNDHYNGSNDETGILKVSTAGRIDGSATYAYYYTSDLINPVDTGTLNSGTLTLNDGVQLDIDPSPAPDFSNFNQGGTSSTLNASTYTEEQDASFTALVESDGSSGQKLVIDWTFADGSTAPSQEVSLNGPLNTPLDIGYGVKLSFSAQPVNNQSLSASINANELNTSQQWSFSLASGRVDAGDTFKVTATPRTLALGQKWEIQGYVPEWNVGDEFVITADHNFVNQAPQVLSNNIVINDPVSGEQILSTVHLTGTGTFETGDEIRIHTRGYTGSASSSGLYTDNLYPTNYIVTITEAGSIGTAKYDWVREDGRTETQFGGSGSGVSSTNATLLEEGVEIAFSDNGTGDSYLAVGDQFIIPAGQKLEYTFAGDVTLQSDKNIEIRHVDATAVNNFGRLIYDGDTPNEAGEEGNILSGPMGSNVIRSINTLNILDVLNSEEAIDTIDEALDQVGYARSNLGAAMNRLESRIQSTSQTMNQLSQARQRIRDADFASEISELARAETIRSASPLLAQVAKLELQRALLLLDSLT